MPNLTTGFPNISGVGTLNNMYQDLIRIHDWAMELTDELKYMFCNLDAGNVMEAAKVKAQNIDCTKARIKSAQIQSLKADKIKTGTLDVSENVTIKGEGDNAKMEMNAQTIVFYEKDDSGKEIPRIYMGFDGEKYVFEVYDKKGNKSIYLNESGEAVFGGTIQTMKDCLIQGELRVGLSGNNTKGISFYGDSYSPDADGNYSTPYARIVPYVANNEDFKGINVEGGKLCVEGELVATKKELEFLKQQIEVLTKRLDALS